MAVLTKRNVKLRLQLSLTINVHPLLGLRLHMTLLQPEDGLLNSGRNQ